MKRFKAYGLGTVVVDHVVVMQTLPEHDTKAEALEDAWQVGGPVPTALSFLARLGARVHFHGRWGGDRFGEMIEADLRKHAVTFESPDHDASVRSGFAHVWVEKGTGRRTISAFRGSHEIAPETLDLNAVRGCDALHLDGWSTDAAIIAARAARESGASVFLDLGSPKPRLEELLATVDVLNCPERLIERLFGDIDLADGAARLHAMGPREVTVTRGEHGALLLSDAGIEEHPGFRVDAIDTNGAGDVFAGATLFAAMQNMAPQERIEFACAAAALKCTRRGNRDALPALKEIHAFTKSRSTS
jgi:sugar/nucleoside kinase (ribokinase family)